QLDKVDESIQHIKHALVLDQDYKQAILFLVNIYTSIDNHEAVIDLITNSKEAGAIDPLYDWELAKAYNETEQYKKALKSYKEASIGLQEDSEFLKEYGYF